MGGTSSIQITTPSGVTDAVTMPLSGTASGLDFPQLSIYDNGTYIGPVGVFNGQWSITVAPIPGANSYTAVGNAHTDPGVASSAVTVTDIQTVPAVTISQPGGKTNSAVQTVSSTASTPGYGTQVAAGSTLVLSDDGAVVGHATVAADGTWSAQITLSSQGSNFVSAIDTDLAGNTGEADVSFGLKTSVPPSPSPVSVAR